MFTRAIRSIWKKLKTRKVAIVAVFAFVVIAPIVNWLVTTEAFLFPEFFGFVTLENRDTWINFFGAILGGGITLIGVAWTIKDQNEKRREDAKDMVRPLLVSGDVTDESIGGIKGDKSGIKIINCTVEYKNVGKGILYNPCLYNIHATIDGVPVDIINPPTQVLSYLEVGSNVNNYIQIILTPEKLAEFYNRLKGRGNAFLLKIELFVGGDDMYGRPVVTKLLYTKSVTWWSEKEIELELFTGKLISTTLFDEKEISEVLENRNWDYKVY